MRMVTGTAESPDALPPALSVEIRNAGESTGNALVPVNAQVDPPDSLIQGMNGLVDMMPFDVPIELG